MSDKWKQLVDLIVNEEEQKASDLFHEIVIENSREIYENLISQEDLDEKVSDDEVKDFEADIKADEEGISEEDEKEVAEDEEKVDESKLEMAPKADMADHADNKASPIAKQQSGGMKVGGKEEAGRPAPKAQDMGGTTKPDMKKV